MSRRWFRLLPCVAVCLCALPFVAADADAPAVTVNESAVRLAFAKDRTTVTLPVANYSREHVRVRVTLELLDTSDRVRGAAVRDESLQPGATSLVINFARSWLDALRPDERSRLLWYRLRYRITPQADGAAARVAPLVEGIISLSQLVAPDVFQLRVSAPEKVSEGMLYRARVRAAHPLTLAPVRGVRLSAEVEFDGDEDEGVKETRLKAFAETDADGLAALDFRLPPRIVDDSGELEITARRGDFTQTASADLDLDDGARILVNTDKPLYQPGQTLHVRALFFDAAKRAIRDAKATLKISDPEDTLVFSAPLVTSRFGVASADWPIPDNTRLGDYSLRVSIDEGRYEDAEAYERVRVSRYELPNFTVAVKPDREYYLPGEGQAAVEVRGDYLFGRPVTRGRVRVVRESSREWNYREQKWDVEEGDRYEGELDKDGRFVARVDLRGEQKELAEADYSRYRDVSYAAYLTDPTTNRTEQRRFDLRLTKQPIHLYVIEDNQGHERGLPLRFYVSTSYADGTPASCDIDIGEPAAEVEAGDNRRSARLSSTLKTIRTNKYGVAKVADLLPPRAAHAGGHSFSLRFGARDAGGRAGAHDESFYYRGHYHEGGPPPAVRLETDKTLYRPGEAVRVTVSAGRPALRVVVEATRADGEAVHSQLVTLAGGRAEFSVPFKPSHRGEITFTAYRADESAAERYSSRPARTVLFPQETGLKLDVQFARASYRPGEEAEARFRVLTARGEPAETALGVVVFDRAVEERARTDREFGGGFHSFYSRWYGDDGSVAGIAPSDLNHVDTSKPVPADLNLVAEILLRDRHHSPRVFGGGEYEPSAATAFAPAVAAQLQPLKDALNRLYAQQAVYPTSDETLRRLLLPAGVRFDELADPWGVNYRARFRVEREFDVTEVWSAGPDKRFDTADDFSALRLQRPYFRFAAEAIDRAAVRHHARTGGYLRDLLTLKAELAREGLDPGLWRDAWGQPVRFAFGVEATRFTVRAESGGPNMTFERAADQRSDDFILWTSRTDYTVDLRARVDDALGKYAAAGGRFPQNEAELYEALQQSGMGREALLDPWGRSYYLTFRSAAGYTDRVQIQTYAVHGQQPQERTVITPVTRHVNYMDLRSAGGDGKEGTADDFNAFSFSRVTAEQSAKDGAPRIVERQVTLSGSTGALSGTVTDPNGAVVPNTTVEATNKYTAQVYQAQTDENGKYLLRNLPGGLYEVRFAAPGFKPTVVIDVPVKSSSLTQVDASLMVGAVMETVEVTAGLAQTSVVNTTVASRSITELPLNGRRASQLSLLAPGAANVTTRPGVETPRLREYFPETLLWQPELTTDRDGRARLQFKLADNITTWKLAVIGSTETGEVGVAERELQAFQAFFVEHDPPRVLTEGDEIALPVVLRNYLDRAQRVALDLKPEEWFALTGPARKNPEVPAGDAARETFSFRAVSSVADGRQQITAVGADASDRIEKPVSVHPDGEEVAETTAQILGGTTALDVNVPANIVPHSARAELKVYPNLMTHVMESVEAVMSRPYGCGEQTISSSYPSLLVLRYYKQTAGGADAKLPPVAQKAERYLRTGYERLLSYRDAASGGFTYWGRGEPDLALTAYALRLLRDAGEFVAVDESVLRGARDYLGKQQRADGSWPAYDWERKEDRRRTILLTAYVARVLAATGVRAANAVTPAAPSTGGTAPGAQNSAQAGGSKAPATPLQRALAYLSARVEESDEPYLIASYALAAADGNAPAAAVKRALDKLRSLARDEGAGSYWALETNTPFYGWGLAGRIETTALAVQALAKVKAEGGGMRDEISATHPSSLRPHPSLVSRGLLFLLRNKDRYGVWLSTQATVNVLDALVALTSARGEKRAQSLPAGAGEEQAEVLVNGQRAGALSLPAGEKLTNPVTLDLSRFLVAGGNRVEIRRAASASFAAAQVVTVYYLPWSASAADGTRHTARSSSALRLNVSYDQLSATVGEAVTCRVEAERVGFRGHGMMLAEVGLPPGADVDRQSLADAMKASGWDLSRYDVLPDRVVLYLWPRAGGTRFQFSFRPRFGLAAKSAPSLLYDYYNPEARAVLAPPKFNVNDETKPAPTQAKRE